MTSSITSHSYFSSSASPYGSLKKYLSSFIYIASLSKYLTIPSDLPSPLSSNGDSFPLKIRALFHRCITKAIIH